MKHRKQWRLGYVSAVISLTTAAVLSTVLTPPYRNFYEPVTIDIDPGMPSTDIAQALEQRGVIQSKWLFLLLRGLSPQTVLMAGEYRFTSPMTTKQVFDKIAQGQVEYHRVVIKEGLTRVQTAEILESRGIFSRQEFLAVTDRPDLIRDLAPSANDLEGFLFPDTYYFTRGITGAEFAAMMVDQFRRVFREIEPESPSGWSPQDVVTLASLIEKETGARGERQVVSSVFHNRLRKNILLQCDPTIIYGLRRENRFRGTIYRSDLRDPQPYNTYVHHGLPPGPIANPGRESLDAAVHPAQTEYMFFVAHHDKPGQHIFSKTVSAHERAVVAYRQSLRNQQGPK